MSWSSPSKDLEKIERNDAFLLSFYDCEGSLSIWDIFSKNVEQWDSSRSRTLLKAVEKRWNASVTFPSRGKERAAVPFCFCWACWGKLNCFPLEVFEIVTWLILPVVICLHQRLSHACLSLNNFKLWNCVQLIISEIIQLKMTYYKDTRSNSRANTCVKSRLSRGGMYLLDKKPMPFRRLLWWIIVTFRIARLHAGNSSFKFLPYQLSTVV